MRRLGPKPAPGIDAGQASEGNPTTSWFFKSSKGSCLPTTAFKGDKKTPNPAASDGRNLYLHGRVGLGGGERRGVLVMVLPARILPWGSMPPCVSVTLQGKTRLVDLLINEIAFYLPLSSCHLRQFPEKQVFHSHSSKNLTVRGLQIFLFHPPLLLRDTHEQRDLQLCYLVHTPSH